MIVNDKFIKNDSFKTENDRIFFIKLKQYITSGDMLSRPADTIWKLYNRTIAI